MLDKFRAWYLRNQVQITWFLIGWLSLSGLQNLVEGDLLGAVICFGLVALNYSWGHK